MAADCDGRSTLDLRRGIRAHLPASLGLRGPLNHRAGGDGEHRSRAVASLRGRGCLRTGGAGGGHRERVVAALADLASSNAARPFLRRRPAAPWPHAAGWRCSCQPARGPPAAQEATTGQVDEDGGAPSRGRWQGGSGHVGQRGGSGGAKGKIW